MSLDLQITADSQEMSQRAADLVKAELRHTPDLLFCASAGGTPTGMYERMAAEYKRQPRLFSKMRVLQVDEWGGLPPNHPATCAGDLQKKLARPLKISSRRYLGFRTDAPNPEQECRRIAEWLRDNGPIDICILGLGLNGHIAMNEPAAALEPHVHVATLAKSSQTHGMLQNLQSKPRFGFTLGMADILSSRLVLLLVSGAHKRAVLKRVLEQRVTTRLPASFLWLHPNAVVLCDKAAAGGQ